MKQRYYEHLWTSSLGIALWLASFGCGSRGTQTSDVFIRDGSTVSVNSTGPEHVSTVGLKGLTRQGGEFTCSAAIIGDDVLVTAAHCILDGAKLYAFFGTDMSQARSVKDYTPVSAATVHPDYDAIPDSEQIVPHDVAILKLSESIPDGYKVVPILPSGVELPNPSTVRLAGFGVTEEGDDPDVLRYVDAKYVGEDKQGRLGINDPGKHGACSGDSGGPLFVKNDGAWYVAGVLSGGPVPCRGVNVYTSLAAHRDFLDDGMRKWGGLAWE